MARINGDSVHTEVSLANGTVWFPVLTDAHDVLLMTVVTNLECGAQLYQSVRIEAGLLPELAKTIHEALAQITDKAQVLSIEV